MTRVLPESTGRTQMPARAWQAKYRVAPETRPAVQQEPKENQIMDWQNASTKTVSTTWQQILCIYNRKDEQAVCYPPTLHILIFPSLMPIHKPQSQQQKSHNNLLVQSWDLNFPVAYNYGALYKLYACAYYTYLNHAKKPAPQPPCSVPF